jgi:hypothetical protein
LRRNRADRRRDEDSQASSAADRDLSDCVTAKRRRRAATAAAVTGAAARAPAAAPAQYGPAVLDLRQSVVPWLAQSVSYCEARDSVRRRWLPILRVRVPPVEIVHLPP